MLVYIELPSVYKMLLQVVLIILLIFQIYLFMSFTLNVKWKKATIFHMIGILMNSALLAALIGIYQYLLKDIEPTAMIRKVMEMPMWLMMSFIFMMLLASVGAAVYLHKLEKNTITDKSIKEATDDLPMALCFAKRDGTPLLVNRKMYMLGLEITGVMLQNARLFWENVSEGEFFNETKRIKGGEEPVLILENGTVWTFSKKIIKIGRDEVVQVLAVNTTDLYNLSVELQKKNESLKAMNDRLQEYSDNVTELMREEEILATKVKIHADMGSALLATRYYLNNPNNKEQAAELIKTWNYNVSLLYKEDVFKHLNEAAKAVGVRIEVEGRIPQNDIKAERIIVAAARECLTNTVRHGDGNLVKINIREERTQYHVVYTNNGAAPEESIKEGGGLMGLRKRVEDIQGSMQIISNPQFVLIINIPKRR